MKFIFLILIFFLSHNYCLAADPSASQIERSQELLDQEGVLRKQIEQPLKVFIKTIAVEGAVSLKEEQIEEITLPFQEKWLKIEEIQQLVDAFRQLYSQQQKPCKNISYEIKDNGLFIKVEE